MNLTPDISRQIGELAGIRVVTSTQAQLAEWLVTRCQALSLPDAPAYVAWLAEPEHLRQEREALSNLLTSRETYFLRDHGVIEVLREHILTEAMAQKASERSLRIWSAGCSTGEEAYTLSILVEEGLVDLNHWHVEILGSDIDQVALAQARQGVYRKWSFRGCPQAFIERYFVQHGDELKLMAHVKQRVRFEQLDIVGDIYPTGNKGMASADIILCRNVFIYLDHAAIDTALKKLTACLNEGGFLLCAPGELHAHSHPQLKARIYPQALVYQKVAAQLQPVLRTPPSTWAASPPSGPLTWPPSVWRATQATRQAAPLLTQDANLAQAWTLANRGDLVAAFSLCDSLVRQQPLSPHVRYLYAVLQFADGQTDQAREALRQVLYLDPQFAVAYAMLNDVCRTNNDTVAALKVCQQGLKAVASLADDQPVPYFKAVTVAGFRQYLQEQIDALTNERDLHER